ncbi:MAG TPA: tRNA (guanosine(37)-N1)-methyltransferase TrmD [Fimbriimonas sp.]|nr:tRNA (guanosine(37)-N1)-methyltransferase TrmD [Fimbriimonas sp.]
MRIDFVTLFPEMVLAGLRHSILARAEERGLVSFGAVNPRDYTYDRHGKVDDTPFGGEPGMLIKVEPVARALETTSLQAPGSRVEVVLTDPAAPLFSQAAAQDLSSADQVVFLCGHYEGFDHRVKKRLATRAYSIGDYVLTNGEMPALVMADAIVRLLPGVLGSAESLAADSHSDGLLSAPNYTRPEVWEGEEVPAVLRSGDHKAVARWRRREALRGTLLHRPDLLAKSSLTKKDLEDLA